MKSNFILRALTGLVFVIVLVGCILFNPLSFGVLCIALSALSALEFGQLVNQQAGVRINRGLVALGAAYLPMAVFHYRLSGEAVAFLPYLLLLIYILVSELYRKAENPIHNWAYSFFSQAYIALPFALFNMLAFQPDNTIDTAVMSYNPILPLSVFVFIWMSDTGAYCIGSLLGRHRLFERISPKKSWEGSVGGGAASLAAAAVFARFFPFMSLPVWLGLALTVVVFGTWGDLVESLLKRHLGIKDSGHILPGHGGMLDRFDSALMAIPAAVVYLYAVSLC